MSKPDEFPQPKGADNTKEGQEARKIKLLKDKRERALSKIFEIFFPLRQEGGMLNYYDSKEWEDFFQKLAEIIKTLLLIDPFENDPGLKKECEEVLLLLDNQDRNQSRKYSDLIDKLWRFFIDNKIYIQSKLP